MIHLIFLEIAGMVQGSQYNCFWTFEPHICTQWELVSQNFTFLGWAMSLNQGLCISFQLKSPMCCHETGRTARISNLQDVNMSLKQPTRQFTLFVAVLSLFLSRFGANLDHSWLYDKCRSKTSNTKNHDFFATTKSIDLKIGTQVQWKHCNHFWASRRHNYQCFSFNIPHFVISDRIALS